MSRNTSGTYTLPISGNPVVSGTTVSSTWANATLSDLATEITSSLDRNGRGPMLQPLQVQDGTAALPSFTFQAEPTSGLYRAGAGDVRLRVNGTEAWQATTSGVTFTRITTTLCTVNGYVGVHGSNPASTTAFTDVVTPKNIPKAWATIKTDGAGGVSVLDGFCVASVALQGGSGVRVTFAQAFTNANYGMLPGPGSTTTPFPLGASGGAFKSTTFCDVGLRAFSAVNTQLTNLNSVAYEFYVSFYGQQS